MLICESKGIIGLYARHFHDRFFQLYTQYMQIKPKPLDVLSILLMLLCIWLPAAMLRSTGWSKGLYLVEILAIISVLAGMGLGRTRLSGGQVGAVFFFLTVVIPPGIFTIALTTTGGPVDRLAEFLIRMNQAVTQVFVGRVIQDSLLFTFFCGYFFWLIGYFTGYGYSRRDNPWQGLLAAAVIFGVIVFYNGSTRSAEWIGAILVFSLLTLAARLFWNQQRFEWRDKRYSIEPGAGRSVFIVAGVVSLLLVLGSWNLQTIILSFTPGTPEQEQFSQFMKDIQSGLQTNIPALQSATSLTGSYPGGLKLGSQAPLQQTEAFQVKVFGATNPVSRYYWRVRVYDQYVNGQWRAPDVANSSGVFVQQHELAGLSAFSQTKIQYIWQGGDGTIVPFAGRVSGVDIATRFEPFSVKAAVSGDGILFPQKMLTRNSLLMVDSDIFTGKDVDLRAANPILPAEVLAENVLVPSNVPQRVIDLGKKLAVGQTMYDRVEAVTNYLRNGYDYKSQISPVPFGKDPVDWFLFESKQGFCNYFASSEVILLRAAGIPARLAVGYSQGERTGDGYQIRMNNGHAWPEVYFSGIGWVPFEPTASEPDTPYSSDDGTGADENQPENPTQRSNNQSNTQPQGSADQQSNNSTDRSQNEAAISRWSGPATLLMLVLLCGAGIWLGVRKNIFKNPPRISRLIMKWLAVLHWPVPNWVARWDWYNSLPEAGRQYVRLMNTARLLRMIPDTTQTPYEVLDDFSRIMPESVQVITLFKTRLYNALYSPDPDYDDETSRTAGAALRKALWNAYWRKLFRQPQR